MSELLTIGQVADRSGVPASALRFYETEGLLESDRTDGGQRRFHRDVLRRVAFIGAARSVGLTIAEIRDTLGRLPGGRTPTRADWTRLSRSWAPRIDERITALERLRDQLDECIGCGCLSLRACALYNPDDRARQRGSGPRYLLGDLPAGPGGR